MSIDLSKLLTERRNANSANIDTLSTLEMLTVINQEDQQVAQAITPYLPQIAEVVDKVATALQAGGRLIYIGAGTSGRLGILDASECPPTFGTRPEQVVGIIAGGHKAILSAVENVEDNKAQGAMDLQNLNFSNRDVLVGLAASGRTPYVIGAMEYAHRQNAFVAIVSCNPHGEMAQLADVAITPVVGPLAAGMRRCGRARFPQDRQAHHQQHAANGGHRPEENSPVEGGDNVAAQHRGQHRRNAVHGHQQGEKLGQQGALVFIAGDGARQHRTAGAGEAL